MGWPQDITAHTAASPQDRKRTRQGHEDPAATRRPLAARGLLAAPLALMAACATPGPMTERAALLAPTTLAAAETTPANAARAPAPDWWRALGDAQLDALMDEALSGAQDPLAAQARLRQAQALAGLAQAGQSPRVSVSAGWSAEHPASRAVPASQGGGQLTRQWRGTVGVDWTPDLWGGQDAEWKAALGDVRAAELSAQEARIQLSVALVQAYLQLAYAHVQGDIAQAEFDRVTDVRRLTLQRLDSGLATQAQLRQTDSDLASASQQQLQARRQVVAAQHALSTLAGQGPGRGERLARPAWPGSAASPWSAVPSPSARAEVPPVQSLPSLPLGLLDRRTDVLAARWRVEAAGARIHVARAAFQPQLNLGALAGLAASRGGDLLRSGAGTYSASLGLTLPLLDGGRRRAGLALQEAQYDEAVAHYNQTLIRAVNEVADQLQAQRSLAEQLDQQQRAREAADEAWQLAQQRYTAGVGSYLDALSVRQQLLVAEQRLATLQSQRLQDSLALVLALGGGFQPAEPPQP
ncbi:efflux transporter outer membrane subunit [Pelomonas sp. APW6]|uniref:Efflux transporter outer membrane subunit n=1 Tax=Roseateles subflavus TaxID=3053353 RepID=A0ABT7LL33_9BURK|nr:efflux transporter outer membrane subunit [Pelomonas sp. APW6]MDL5033543.1 efflux transporter outer membrane subunit [Pelomonas sp. APW6]